VHASETTVHVSRRGLLVGVVLGSLAGCVGARPETSSSGPPQVPRSTFPGPTTVASTPSPPAAGIEKIPLYTPERSEVEPACKVAAIRAVSTALTWSPETGGAEAAITRLIALGTSARARTDLKALTGRQIASSFQTIYPQYGGLSNDLISASVMIVGEQVRRSAPGTDVERRGLTMDVRLKRSAKGWQVVAVHNAAPPSPQANSTALAGRVLAEKRLFLPALAQADIRAGLIDERLLSLLKALSQRWDLRVQVLKSGHPRNVFPTNRVSNHTRGRAVDIWEIAGTPVIEAPKALWRSLMLAAAARGATEIGGPGDVGKVADRTPFFTNAVHQDHVHIGFEA
jgi:hypothetical protein